MPKNLYAKYLRQRSFHSEGLSAHKHTHTHIVNRLHYTATKGVSNNVESMFPFHLQCESKKAIHLTFDHNFGKCRPIYKMLPLTDFWGNSVHIHHKDSPPRLQYVSLWVGCETWQLKIGIAADFNGVLHVRLRIHLARYEAALMTQVWIIWL